MSLNEGTMMTMPVAPTGMGGYGGMGGFGGDGWWIILFLLVCGWGNNGWGNGSGNGYDTRADLQRGFDNSAVVSKLDGINHGLCDSTYALNNTMTNGFANAELSRCNQQSAFMQQLFNMQMADQQCCCETQRLIERGFCDTNYNFTTQACDTRNTIQTSTRDIIENQNANSRAILDFLTQDKLSTLQAENQTLKLAASQANQNAVIGARIDASTAEVLRRVAPLPVPSYPVPNPYTGQYGYGYNGGCGCNPCCA